MTSRRPSSAPSPGCETVPIIGVVAKLLEKLAANPSAGVIARIFYHTGHKGAHLDDGSSIREIVSAYDVLKTLDAYDSVLAGTWTTLLRAAGLLNAELYNFSNAQNDGLRFRFTSKAGSLVLVLLGQTDSNMGIVTVTLDGVSQGTIDLYTASLATDVYKTLTLTVVTDGEHALDLEIKTRNASSTGWYLVAAAIWLRSA